MQRLDTHPSLELRLQPLGLPPLDSLDHAGVRKAATAAAALETAFRERQEFFYALEQRRPEVEAEDRKALAEAMRRNEADPGDAALQEHDAKIAGARREAEAAFLAAEGARRDLGEAIERVRPGWLGRRQERLDEARKAIGTAVEQLAAALDRFAEARAFAVWLADYPLRRFSPLGSDVPLLQANGSPYRSEAVLAALATLAEAPAPPPEPPVHLPLGEQRRRLGVAPQPGSS